MESEEFRRGEVMPVALGVVVRGQFVQITRGLLVSSEYPYYLLMVVSRPIFHDGKTYFYKRCDFI